MEKDTNAIGIVRQMVTDGQVSQEVAERYFPELKDSEDEKIRKELLKHVQYLVDYYNDSIPNYGKWLTWLENQGAHTALSKDEQNKLAKGVLRSCAFSFINYLDSHRYEGKMDVSNGECDDIENAFQNAMWDRLHRYYCKYIEKQGEQKPAEWSEIDKANLEDSIYFVKEFRRSNLCDNESRLQNSRTCIEWLASLKDRVLPQPKQEWSEEDRKIIIELIGIFESAVDGGHVSFPYRLIKDYIRVLKSCLPQNTWKPSEEQLKMLDKTIGVLDRMQLFGGRNALIDLKHDLKKLRGE